MKIENIQQFNEIGVQKGKYCDSRENAAKLINDKKSNNDFYSTFTEIYEEGWFIIPGIHWANAIGYWIIDGEYELKNDYIEE